MICLSKADEDSFRRSTWNQAPSPLAPQHTTRQDMNGISNLREHVEAGQADGGCGGGAGGGLFDSSSSGDTQGGDDDEVLPVSSVNEEASVRSDARVLASTVKNGGDGRSHLPIMTTTKSGTSAILSWATWLLSVVIASLLLNNLPLFLSGTPLTIYGSSPQILSDTFTIPNDNGNMTTSLPGASIITKRADACEKGGVGDKSEYNTPLHAGAVIIIWFVSTLGCGFPILAKKFPGLRIPTRFFFTVRHFGTGVLIATAFVHLLPTAFISLGNPCLGEFWTEKYEAMPGAIALAAIFFVTVIEMVFHPSRHLPTEPSTPENGLEERLVQTGAPLRRTCSESTALPLRGMAPLHGSTANIGYGLTYLQSNGTDRVGPIRENRAEAQATNKPNVYQSSHESSSSLTTWAEHKLRKERLQCVLLELGILFHSVFIGMALSVSVGSDFVILLIAIVFHQTFEGLALGSRIASVTWGEKTKQPWLMAAAYGCTTPIGQAIGLATSSLYSPDSKVGLLLVGTMNAISAGLLTYASLVELLSEDFLSDESWRILRGKKRIIACILVFFGAFFMSLVGAWA